MKLNPVLDAIYRTGQVEDAAGNLLSPFPTSVREGLGVALYDLLLRERFTRTLEVGMAYGLSSLFLCQAHHDRGEGRHIAIDPGQSDNFKGIGRLNVQRAGFDPVFRFLEAPSHEALPQLLAERTQLDFAFIDGLHLFDYTLIDFFYVDRMLRVGGYVAFDDLWMPAVRKAVSFALRNYPYELVAVDVHQKLPLWIRAARVARKLVTAPWEAHTLRLRLTSAGTCFLKKRANDDRSWDHYRSF